MKIGLVIGAYHQRGGLERVAVETARGLRDRGHRVVVVTQRAETAALDHDIEILKVGGFSRQIAARAATFPVAATRAVSDLQLDVVYAFGSSVLAPAVVSIWTTCGRNVAHASRTAAARDTSKRSEANCGSGSSRSA